MEAIYNKDQKIIVAACARCGSQHLRKISRQILFHQYNYFDTKFQKTLTLDEYKLVHVVRDPYYRWRSWFYDFVWQHKNQLDLNLQAWTIDDARAWMKKFDILRHYNTHTGFQQVLFDLHFAESLFGSHEYIMMNDIDKYLNLSPFTRTNYDTHAVKEDLINPDVVSYMKYKIMELYQDDYIWLKNLKIWNNGVDTLTKMP